jgi:hypothetical protein
LQHSLGMLRSQNVRAKLSEEAKQGKLELFLRNTIRIFDHDVYFC